MTSCDQPRGCLGQDCFLWPCSVELWISLDSAVVLIQKIICVCLYILKLWSHFKMNMFQVSGAEKHCVFCPLMMKMFEDPVTTPQARPGHKKRLAHQGRDWISRRKASFHSERPTSGWRWKRPKRPWFVSDRWFIEILEALGSWCTSWIQ